MTAPMIMTTETDLRELWAVFRADEEFPYNTTLHSYWFPLPEDEAEMLESGLVDLSTPSNVITWIEFQLFNRCRLLSAYSVTRSLSRSEQAEVNESNILIRDLSVIRSQFAPEPQAALTAGRDRLGSEATRISIKGAVSGLTANEDLKIAMLYRSAALIEQIIGTVG